MCKRIGAFMTRLTSHKVRNAEYLFGTDKTFRLREEVSKGHEKDQGEVGKEKDQVPETFKTRE